jgi:hypothetical protein
MEDPTVKLSRFRADLSRSLARRGRTLLEAADLPAQVAALDPLEAYFIVKELGVEAALPILRHASPEQLQTFIDLDCWDGDRPDPVEIDAWLTPFASDGPRALSEAFLSLEPELGIWFLATGLEVYDSRSEVPPPRRDVPRVSTPDSFFVLDAPGADRRELNMLALVEALYAADPHQAFRLLMAAKWELTSPLQETAFQFRRGRLEELGFPPPDEAQRIFAMPPNRPRAKYPVAPMPTRLPALYAERLKESSSLLTRALARISEPQALAAIESDLVYLINAAVIAYGETPRDLAHTTEIAARVRDTLSLGLEVLLSADHPLPEIDTDDAADQAAALLGQWPLRDVFGHGHHAVAELHLAARDLAQDPRVRAWLDTPTSEKDDYSRERVDREFLRALSADPPMWGGVDLLRAERRRAFGRLADLNEAEQRLDAIARRFMGSQPR